MRKYRITGPKIETIPPLKTKRKKSRRGIGLMVLGSVMFAGSAGMIVGTASTETSSRIKELKERFEQPVIESSLYLNQDYETERAELSSMQEEYASLSEERKNINLFGRILPVSLAVLSSIPFGCGITRYQNQKFRRDFRV